MTGMLLPAGTPRAIVNKLFSETARIVALPEVKERISEMGYNILMSSPQQFTAQITEEVEKWGKVIRSAGIKVD